MAPTSSRSSWSRGTSRSVRHASVSRGGSTEMDDRPTNPGTAPVTDHRPIPRGVLPRSAQAWLMAALAVGMLGIIFIAGRPALTPTRSSGTAVQPQGADAARVREYQERQRALEAGM